MDTQDEPTLLIRALRRVLYPLVKLSLNKGVTFPQFQELLKSVFVEVAEREFRLIDKEQTDSRISLLSGLHRKDVKRLRAHPATETSVTRRSIPLGAQVVASWSGNPDYLDGDGLPRPIPRMASAEHRVSFEQLVASINKDIRPRALLDEWLRQGIVEKHDDEMIALKLDAFVPQAGIEEKLFYFGNNLTDHAAAATQNICGDGPPLFERCVHYNDIDVNTITALQKLTETRGMKLLLDANRLASSPSAENSAPSSLTLERFTLGIYFYRTQDTPLPQTQNESE
jgi:hypothetical protein